MPKTILTVEEREKAMSLLIEIRSRYDYEKGSRIYQPMSVWGALLKGFFNAFDFSDQDPETEIKIIREEHTQDLRASLIVALEELLGTERTVTPASELK